MASKLWLRNNRLYKEFSPEVLMLPQKQSSFVNSMPVRFIIFLTEANWCINPCVIFPLPKAMIALSVSSIVKPSLRHKRIKR